MVNNVMLGNTFHPHVWFEGSRDILERNIIFTVYKDIGLRGWGESIDYNLIYGSGAGGRGTGIAGEIRDGRIFPVRGFLVCLREGAEVPDFG